jgi:hypothetical protein
MIKLGFELDVQDGWPPFEVEHLWAEQTDAGYVVKSVPFFVKDMALDDTISASIGEYNYVKDWHLLEKSGNSTLWIIKNSETDILDKLEGAGCHVEGGAMPELYSVNVPKALDFGVIEALISPNTANGSIDVAYPAVRHAD